MSYQEDRLRQQQDALSEEIKRRRIERYQQKKKLDKTLLRLIGTDLPTEEVHKILDHIIGNPLPNPPLPRLTMSNRIYSTRSGLRLEFTPARRRRKRLILLCVAVWGLVLGAAWFLSQN